MRNLLGVGRVSGTIPGKGIMNVRKRPQYEKLESWRTLENLPTLISDQGAIHRGSLCEIRTRRWADIVEDPRWGVLWISPESAWNFFCHRTLLWIETDGRTLWQIGLKRDSSAALASFPFLLGEIAPAFLSCPSRCVIEVHSW